MTGIDGARSLWWDGAGGPSSPPPLPPPARFDVVVVGGGLAGLSTALRLVEDGARVLVLEAAHLAARTTGNTTAKVTALHGAAYSRLTDSLGAEAAATYALANTEGLRALVGTVGRLGVDCALTTATAATCAETDDGQRTIEAELAAAAAAGLPVRELTDPGLPFPVRRAVALPDQAHFHPVRFCLGLADHLRGLGVTIVEGARAMSVDEDPGGCQVRTRGFTVVADAVVLATHLPVSDPALIAARVRPERSYALAGPSTSPLPDGMYLSIDRGWSCRPATAPDGSAVHVVGGEGHAMTDHVDTARHHAALEAVARNRFRIDRPTHRWSAFDYVTTDHVPFIGRLAPHRHRTFVATGFGKWGMTTSMVAARILADLVAGRDDPYDGLFDATRLRRPLTTSAFVRTGAAVTRRFVGDRLTRQGDEPLAPGQGRVERRGGRQVARSVDLDGTVHEVAARCTHLGCIVGFNDADRSWDCPCHGSRFALDGSVLEGPAVHPLGPA